MSTTIEVFADYVCPFCYLAEQPLADAVVGRDVDVVWQPFELRPEPAPTLHPEGDYLQSTWREVVYPAAERMGVPIALPDVSPQPHSRLAFEGCQFASEHGLGQRWTERMFRMFFVEQRDIGQLSVLIDVAVDLRLDGDTFRSALESGSYTEVHQRALKRADELDITAVPTFLVGDRRIEGMASAEQLVQLIDG